MPKLHNVKPHPAFDSALCTRYRSTGASFGMPQGKTGQVGTSTGKTGQPHPHYDHAYMEHLAPVARTVDAPVDVVGVGASGLVGMFGSMLIALLNPTWIFDSMGLGLGAFLTTTRECIYLRRVLLMAVRLLVISHGCLAGHPLSNLLLTPPCISRHHHTRPCWPPTASPGPLLPTSAASSSARTSPRWLQSRSGSGSPIRPMHSRSSRPSSPPSSRASS